MSLAYHQQTIGFILEHLISGGLSRVDLSGENAMEIMLYRERDEEEVLMTFNDVLHWMLDEGLIRAASVQEGDLCDYFNSVQLTAKGLSIVNVAPDQDAELEKNVVDTVSDPPEGGLEADVYGKIGSFVGGLLGGFGQSYN